jgi:ribosomal-protein-alanine N-acetyltransferase
MSFILETERLRISEFTFDDTGFIIQLLNSPGWIKYIGDRNVKTTEDAKHYLQAGPMKSYALRGFGLYRIDLKAENKSIGMCGLLKRDTLEFPDIGFAFLQDYEGKGYALEASAAMVRYARERLNLTTLLAITLPDNGKSIRLLTALGFVFIGSITMPGDEKALYLYRSEKTSEVNSK